MGRGYNAPTNQVPSMRHCTAYTDIYDGVITKFVGGTIVTGEYRAPSAGYISKFDTRIDWRDRLLCVSGFAVIASPNLAQPRENPELIFPRSVNIAGSGFSLNSDMFATCLGWTGNPADGRGGVGKFNFCNFRDNQTGFTSSAIYLYADSADGALTMQFGVAGISGTFLIIATENTGYTTPID